MKKREGAFCVWSRDELGSLLSGSVTAASSAEVNVIDVVCFHYDVKPDGNVSVHKARTALDDFNDILSLLAACICY